MDIIPSFHLTKRFLGCVLACFVPKTLVKKNVSERVQASGGEGIGKPLRVYTAAIGDKVAKKKKFISLNNYFILPD